MRILLFFLLALGIAAGATFVIFKSSPWVQVFVIRHLFAMGDRRFKGKLEKHVPNDIYAEENLAYGSGEDEKFDIYRPAGEKGPMQAIVWVHGGGWIAGSKEGISNYLKILAGHGYAVIGVEYSRGIKTPYPKPLEQVNAALGYIMRNAGELGLKADGLVLAGDSAGAQMVSQISMLTTDPSYAGKTGIVPSLQARQIAAVLLFSGAYDLEAVNLNARYGWLAASVLRTYAGTRDFLLDDQFRLASVRQYVSGSFPRTFITSGDGDPLAPQAVDFAHRLQALGVKVDSLFFSTSHGDPLGHEYQFDLDRPEGQLVLQRALAFLGNSTG